MQFFNGNIQNKEVITLEIDSNINTNSWLTFIQTTNQTEYYFNSIGSNASSGEYIISIINLTKINIFIKNCNNFNFGVMSIK